MKTIKTDENNNLIFENGQPVMIDGINATASSTRTRIGLITGEDTDNPTDGIDFFTEFSGVMGGQYFLINNIRERVAADPDHEIIAIKDIRVNYDNKTLSVTLDIETIYGTIKI